MITATTSLDTLAGTIDDETKTTTLVAARDAALSLCAVYEIATSYELDWTAPTDDESASILQALTEIRDHSPASTDVVLRGNPYAEVRHEGATADQWDVDALALALRFGYDLTDESAREVAGHLMFVHALIRGEQRRVFVNRDAVAALIAGFNYLHANVA